MRRTLPVSMRTWTSRRSAGRRVVAAAGQAPGQTDDAVGEDVAADLRQALLDERGRRVLLQARDEAAARAVERRPPAEKS